MTPDEFKRVVEDAIIHALSAIPEEARAARETAADRILVGAFKMADALNPARPDAVYVGKCEFHRSRIWYHAEGARCDCPCHDSRPRLRPSIFPSEETS